MKTSEIEKMKTETNRKKREMLKEELLKFVALKEEIKFILEKSAVLVNSVSGKNRDELLAMFDVILDQYNTVKEDIKTIAKELKECS